MTGPRGGLGLEAILGFLWELFVTVAFMAVAIGIGLGVLHLLK